LGKLRLGIETKQRGQRLEINPVCLPIAPAYLGDQIGKRLEPQTIGAEFHMTGLMSGHHQKEPRVIFSSGVAAQERRKRNSPAIRAHCRSHRRIRRE
jgi:hypothetical protein